MDRGIQEWALCKSESDCLDSLETVLDSLSENDVEGSNQNDYMLLNGVKDYLKSQE